MQHQKILQAFTGLELDYIFLTLQELNGFSINTGNTLSSIVTNENSPRRVRPIDSADNII